MKRMLINATQPEEIRLAMVDGQKLLNFEIEQCGREQRKGNIYKAVITRIEPSLEACFVDYGEERQGFLPFKEVSKQYFPPELPVSQAKINEALQVGQELIVQVEKEERGNKNAALTTFISLAGRYLVLMPNKPRSGGVSRRIEGDERQDLKDAMDQLEYPKGMSLIARTAGIGRAVNELQWDLNYLLSLWRAIDDAAASAPGTFLIYNESALVIRAIRDYYTSDISEILIDTNSFYDQAHKFMELIMPEDARKVKRYRDETALFARFQIEKQIESAYARIVMLPSGGSIVLDHTEALVAIDVNSARATRGGDIEETATNTNLEAADEIARQLRLRDLGGLVVIDFIDMEDSKNRQEVENRLRHALKQDRARIRVSSISRFGLLELSRQRLRPALFEGASITCPRCNGTGHIRDTESSALQILRIIQEEAIKDNTAAIRVQVPVDVTSYLLNKKREEITKIEVNHRVNVVLVPNKQLETPNYNLERIKTDDPQLETLKDTYVAGDSLEDADAVISKAEQKTNRQEPVIKSFLPDAPPPAEQKTKTTAATEPKTGGFWGWLKGLFTSTPEEEPQPKPAQSKRKPSSNERGQRNNNRRNNNEQRNERGDRSNRTARNRDSNERNSAERSNAERSNERRNNQRQNNRDTNKDASQEKRSSRRKDDNTGTMAITAELSANVDIKENSTARTIKEPREPKENKRKNQAPAVATEYSNETIEQTSNAQSHTPVELPSEGSNAAEPPKRERKERRQRRQEEKEQTLSEKNPEFDSDEESRQISLPQDDVAQPQNQLLTSAESEENGDTIERPRTRRTRDRYGRDRRQRNAYKDETQSGEESLASSVMPLFAESQTDETALTKTATASAENAPSSGLSPDIAPDIQQQEKPQSATPATAKPDTSMQPQQLPIDVATSTVESPWTQTPQGVSPVMPSGKNQVQDTGKNYTLPQDELAHIAQSVGLQWVATNPERAAAVQVQIQNEPTPIRAPREPKPTAQAESEPLVMVETQKILSNLHKTNHDQDR